MEPLSEISKKINVFANISYQGLKDNVHAFVYEITIENHSDHPVQLLDRYWLIKDALYEAREVEGEGGIGQQPIIGPAENFSYHSWCPLISDYGMMSGHYTFLDVLTNETFKVDVPQMHFVLPELMN